jgi:hypothetical protein
MITLICHYTDPPHEHTYPDDWIFGGASGNDPRADPRYKACTYTYYDADASALWITQTPLCDDRAIDEFTKIANMGKTFNPKWLGVKRPDESVDMLPWVYDKQTDTATFVERPMHE